MSQIPENSFSVLDEPEGDGLVAHPHTHYARQLIDYRHLHACGKRCAEVPHTKTYFKIHSYKHGNEALKS